MNKTLESRVIGTVLIMILTLALPARAGNTLWTGAAGDNRWDNPANWLDGIVPSESDRAIVNGPDAGPGNGPTIAEGTDAVTEILISEAGLAHMSMTGGSLALTGWGSWWGDGEGNEATFDMSGGLIEYTGNPGIFEMSWRPSDAPSGSSTGIWNMTGGEIFALGVSMPATEGEIAVMNLHGGTFNVGLARGGLTLQEGALIDITEGQLILEGDQSGLIDDYIFFEWIVAYGGTGDVVISVDDFFTTVTATGGFPSGDCNGDGVIDAADLACVATIEERDTVLATLNTLPGDLNGNGDVAFADFLTLSANFGTDGLNYTEGNIDLAGTVAFADFLILSANFGKTPAAGATATAVPEPSSCALLALGALVMWRRRR